MTTGRIVYPPDYESARSAADDKLDAAFEAIYRRYGTNLSAFFEDAYKAQRERANRPDASAERVTLERQVIEAAKKWREDWLFNSTALRDAVDALTRFEAKQR